MKVRNIGLGIVLASFTLASAAPAIAQSDPRGGGGPPGGGASERSGGGGASTSSGTVGGGGGDGGGGGFSGGSSGSGGGGGFNSPSMGAATSSNLSSADRGTRASAPERRSGYSSSSTNSSDQDSQKANPRNAAGSGSGERAVPRGASGDSSSSGSSGSSGGNANSGRSRTRPDASSGNNSSGTREVPQWSRPRGDRPATGVAVDRVGPPPDRNRDNRGRYGTGGGYGYYDPYYYGGGYGYGSNYGGYYGYSPYYYPYGFGMGYGLYSGLGWNPYYGDPMDSYYGGAGGYSSGTYNTRDQGNLKLKVKPRSAKVYVDGYFVGTVDQFDGAFQKLALNGGRHKVEVRADGFETAEFDVLITPSQTITFQGELKRIQ